jgi:hypothetical protein
VIEANGNPISSLDAALIVTKAPAPPVETTLNLKLLLNRVEQGGRETVHAPDVAMRRTSSVEAV